MKAKNSYSVDARNRLVIKGKGGRIAPRGRFTVDKKNYLYYWLNEPSAWRREYRLPPRIKFAGNWQLSREHDLVLKLTKTPGQNEGERLVLKGNIIAAESEALVFELEGDKNYVFSLLKLGGFWQADEFNRIGFIVKKDAYPHDTLTLQGSWQVNKNQEIVYTYKKTRLLTREKIENSIIFKGFWRIDSAKQLAYIFERDTKSAFNFRAHLETPNLYPKKGEIKYRLGIGVKGLSPEGTVPDKIICLYGTWKFSRKLGVSFEMDYGRARVQKTDFSAELILSDKDKIILGLLAKDGRPLGISLTFKRALLKKYNAEAFLKLGKRGEGLSLEAGMKLPF